MAVTNLQNLVVCVAKIHGAVVTGTQESKRAAGSYLAPFCSMPSLRLDGPFPMGTNPDNQGVLQAGRSASELGVEPCARTSPSYPCAIRAALVDGETHAWLTRRPDARLVSTAGARLHPVIFFQFLLFCRLRLSARVDAPKRYPGAATRA